MRKFMFFFILVSVFSLFISCSPSDYLDLGDNIKPLDNSQRTKLFENVLASNNNYPNTAHFIYVHVNNVINYNERPLFYNNVTMGNIYGNSMPHIQLIIDYHWEKGDLVFARNSFYIGGFITAQKNNNIYFLSILGGRPVLRSLHIGNIRIRRIMVYVDL